MRRRGRRLRALLGKVPPPSRLPRQISVGRTPPLAIIQLIGRTKFTWILAIGK